MAEGVGLPEAFAEELPQKKWEQEARKALQQLEVEPDFNVKLQRTASTYFATGTDRRGFARAS